MAALSRITLDSQTSIYADLSNTIFINQCMFYIGILSVFRTKYLIPFTAHAAMSENRINSFKASFGPYTAS